MRHFNSMIVAIILLIATTTFAQNWQVVETVAIGNSSHAPIGDDGRVIRHMRQFPNTNPDSEWAIHDINLRGTYPAENMVYGEKNGLIWYTTDDGQNWNFVSPTPVSSAADITYAGGRWFVSASGNVYEVNASSNTLRVPSSQIFTQSIASDGSSLYIAAPDKVRKYNIDNWTYTDLTYDVSIAGYIDYSDGNLLVKSSSSTVKILESGSTSWTTVFTFSSSQICWMSDGGIAVGNGDYVDIWRDVPPNQAPVANDDNATTNEDVAKSIAVLSNDTDPDGDALSISSFTQGAHGTVSQSGSQLVYTPSANYNGSDSFTYVVTDGSLTDQATVSVTVNAVNDAPVAVDDNSSTNENVSVTIDVLSNDSDVDGDNLTVSAVTQSANGSVVNNGTDVTFTPTTGFSGTAVFTYTVSDGNGGTDVGNVSVTVSSVNDAPVANDDAASTNEDVAKSIAVLANDTDPDGDALSISSFTQGAHGTVSQSGSQLVYTPSANYNGSDSFTYVVTDGSLTDQATVTMTINAVNDNPVAVDDNSSTNENVAVTIDVLSNDSDVDGDNLTVSAVTQSANGSVVNNGTDVTFTPTTGFSGTAVFTYTVSDGNGGTDVGNVSVTVSSVNDAPVANDDAASTNEDVAKSIAVLANDTDPDGDALSISSFTQGAHGTVSQSGSQLVYTPSANYNGSDSFTYVVTDGSLTDQATVSITVNSVNDNPVANDDAASTNEDVAKSIAVLANDTDPDGDALSISSFTQGAHGTVSQSGSQLVYTPSANYNGSDSFTYVVTDGSLTDQATVTMTINAVNDNPVAVDDNSGANENTPVTVNVLANDSDVDGDNLTVSSVTQPSNGSATNNGSNVTYTPSNGFIGNDAFTYTVSDGNGGSATATVNVSVNNVNDAPVAVNDDVTTSEDTAKNVAVLANDSDPDGDDITISSFSQGTNGTVTQDGNELVYTPHANFNGNDSFTYEITDGELTDEATVNVTVTPVNDIPIAVDDNAVANENVSVDIDVLSNDTDVDGDNLTVSAVTQPSNGTVTNNSTNVTYTPANGFIGNDTFTYTVSDGNGGSATATVNVSVNNVNDAPVATDDNVSTFINVAKTLSVLNNDTDPDGDALSISSFTQGTNGTVTQSGNDLIYTPNNNYIGLDQFNYTVSDGSLTDEGTVFIEIVASAKIDSILGDPVGFVSNEFNASFTTNDDGTTFSAEINSSLGNVYTVTGFDISGTPSNAGEDQLTLTLSYDNGDVADTNWTLSVYSSKSPIPAYGNLGGSVVSLTANPDEFGWYRVSTPIQPFAEFYNFTYDTVDGLVGEGIDSLLLDVVSNGDSLAIRLKRKVNPPSEDYQFALEIRDSGSLWHQTAAIEILLPENTLQWGALTYVNPFIYNDQNPPEVPILYYASDNSDIEVLRSEDDSTLTTRAITRTGTISEEFIVEKEWVNQDTTHMNFDVQMGSLNLSVSFSVLDTTTTGIRDLNLDMPTEFLLSQNYPNPFNPSTKINFSLPERSDVKLVVYDITGQEVARLFDGNLPAGEFSYEWSADHLASGVYIYRLIAGDFVQTKKMMLLK